MGASENGATTTNPGRTVRRAFYNALMAQLGEAEYSRANPKVIKFLGNDLFILRVSLERYEQSIVAVTLAKSLGGKPIGFYTLKASGTIRALQK